MIYLDIPEKPFGIFYPTNDYNSGRMELYFPDALNPDGGLTIPQLRKFFKLCLQNRHYATANEMAVHELDQYLKDYVLACKNAAEDMRIKKAEKLYERSMKILKIWNESKEQYT